MAKRTRSQNRKRQSSAATPADKPEANQPEDQVDSLQTSATESEGPAPPEVAPQSSEEAPRGVGGRYVIGDDGKRVRVE